MEPLSSGITPYDVREYSLQDIPVDERELADRRLLEKVTSGAEKITPHDLQYVSRDMFRNVINNFEPANKKTAQNPWKISQDKNGNWNVEHKGTYINHYHATHGKHPWGFDMGAERQMDRKFDTGDSLFRKKGSMFKKIKQAQKITGMKHGGKVKKTYAKGGGVRKAKRY